jgi:saccharopine dehydrogenase-like NADP-dependent oxidoreductase
MARTTGFTASAAADMILNNVFSKKGIFPPELVGKIPECFHYNMDYLNEEIFLKRKQKSRNTFYYKSPGLNFF